LAVTSVLEIVVTLAGYAVGSLFNPLLWLIAVAMGLSRLSHWGSAGGVIFALMFCCFIPLALLGPSGVFVDWPIRVAVVGLLFWAIVVITRWWSERKAPAEAAGDNDGHPFHKGL
jgi:hypothetical protein